VYRTPVRGTLVTGFDELSDSGVRSRGLTFETAPRARVVAPAAGTVRYARRFRDYGLIIIIDHADGWTSLVTGLAATPLRPGDRIAMGAPIGLAPREDSPRDDVPRITVELRRRGRPVDAASLMGPPS
jgi:septal ring factor EnvC (AmiA/AmiB activator)